MKLPPIADAVRTPALRPAPDVAGLRPIASEGVVTGAASIGAASDAVLADLPPLSHRPAAEVADLGGFGLMPLRPTRTWLQARIDASRAAAIAEADLRSAGDRTLKLAKDAATGAAVVLRPGQDGYDAVRSAAEVWMGLARDLALMGYTPADFVNLPQTDRRA